MGNGGYCGTESGASRNSAGRVAPHALSPVLYLNRCVGGCSFTGANNHNAPMNLTAIRGTVVGRGYSFPEFSNYAAQRGTAADAEWNAIVACVKETYSYFNVQVTDQRPTAAAFHMAVITGLDDDLMIGPQEGIGQLLGISDVDCAGPIENVISFTLADEHRPFAGSVANYIRNVCVTAAHEIGHAYGLEHEFRFLGNNQSACSDPMSYDVGACDPPQRYFRNEIAACGEFMERQCSCATPNSHKKLTSVFGPGTPTVPPPSVTVVNPQPSAQLGNIIVTTAGSKRGVSRVELYINGHKWNSSQGVPFTVGAGQPNPGTYTFPVPPTLPNSIVDVEIRAYDDLEAMSVKTVTATKGAPCASADTCAKGQKCEAGKCFWDPPTGQIGDDCTYPEFCASGICQGTAEQSICTQACIPGVVDSCPMGGDEFTCIESSPGKGICFFKTEEGGCCSANNGELPWAPAALSLGILGFIVIRRRRA